MSYEHLYLVGVTALLLSLGIITFIPMPSKITLRAVYGLAIVLLTFCISWPAINVYHFLKFSTPLLGLITSFTSLLTLLTLFVILHKEGKIKFKKTLLPMIGLLILAVYTVIVWQITY